MQHAKTIHASHKAVEIPVEQTTFAALWMGNVSNLVQVFNALKGKSVKMELVSLIFVRVSNVPQDRFV